MLAAPTLVDQTAHLLAGGDVPTGMLSIGLAYVSHSSWVRQDVKGFLQRGQILG